MSHVPELQVIPADVVNLDDFARHAEARLDANAWAYFSGGAADEITKAANALAWRELPLQTRVLRSLKGGHTRTEFLGRVLAHPILLAPVAFQRMAHVDGELATAYAAAMQGAGMVLSCQASLPLEQVSAAYLSQSDRGPLWFQLYVQHDRAFTLDLVRRAQAAGYEALVVTVDAPSSGVRDRERRVGFCLPEGVEAVNLRGLGTMPLAPLRPGQSAMFDGLLNAAPTWDDIAWLVGESAIPVILKGITHPADARLAMSLGAAAVIVSNHGGRTLDTLASTAALLPRVVDAVGSDMPVLVDGGIRRGTDVLKAIALGARAALIGRPYVYALATSGALGVANAVRLLRDELEIAMALSGCATLADVGPDVFFDRDDR